MATTARQDKILATIERLNARKEKFENGGYDKKYEKMFGDDDRAHYHAEYNDDKFDYYKITNKKCKRWEYYRDVDYCRLIRQIKDNEIKLDDAKRLDAKQDSTAAKKAEKAEVKKVTIDNLPKPIADFREKMIKLNTEYMLDRYHYIRGLGYSACRKQGLMKEYNYFMSTNEKQIKKDVIDNMDNMALNLMTRIKDKVGNIESASGLRVTRANQNEGYAINGTVTGDKGSCNVHSISAGGYNIQCWHIRTIIR
nr:MAG TPA: hypothetical protein [Caudoviricetes sp.]